ncbi:unnamed protein product [Arabis nemorensis]|uniref:Uncharacterized protein n=1 Tax=Arabis nemorensis TaxID=586526 RepID=A0A565BBQ7_9BRAS|nr:unnamed protein product [Arabis nemorensis]
MLEPNGKLTTPVDLINNFFVETFMAVRFEHETMGLGVITGDDDVNRYQLQRNDNYSVGGCSKQLVPSQNGLDVQSISYRGVEGGRYIMASQSVLEEIFTAEERAVLERNHMERAKKMAAGGQFQMRSLNDSTPNRGIEIGRTVAPMSVDTEGDSEAWTPSFTAAVGLLNLVTPSKEDLQEQLGGFETPNSNPQCSQRKPFDKGKGKVMENELGDNPSLQLTMGRSSVSATNKHEDDTEQTDDDSSDSSLYGGEL